MASNQPPNQPPTSLSTIRATRDFLERAMHTMRHGNGSTTTSGCTQPQRVLITPSMSTLEVPEQRYSQYQHSSASAFNFCPPSQSRHSRPNVGTSSNMGQNVPTFQSSHCSTPSTSNFNRLSSNPPPRVHRPPWMQERSNLFGSRKSNKKSKKGRIAMWEHEFICLAKCGQTIPPSPMEKAELINAGLGPRKLSLFESGVSWEFHEEIMSAFPKLSEGGGYELMRTQPNNNRELCVIPPKSGGYTVEYLKNIVSQAKIFIRPIQKDLSLVPLIVNDDLGLAPSEKCIYCDATLPMHQLRDHVQQCSAEHRNEEDNSWSPPASPRNENTVERPSLQTSILTQLPSRQSCSTFASLHTTERDCDSPLSIPSPVSPPLPSYELSGTPKSVSHQRSPLAPDFSPITNSNTSDAAPDYVDLTAMEDEMVASAIKRNIEEDVTREPTSLKDAISLLQNKCGLMIPKNDSEWEGVPRMSIDVRREYVLTDGLREAKKSRFEPMKLLRVHFVSEPGIDTGGPSREFWRLFADGVMTAYCIGNDHQQYFFNKNVPALQAEEFKSIGKLVATSIVQGGYGLPIFHPAVYHYLISGEYLGQVTDDKDVPDPQVRMLLSEIDNAATDEDIRSIFDDDNESKGDNDTLLLETGFRKAFRCLTIADRPALKATLRDYHSLIKIKPELDQFSEGLKTLGVLDLIQKYPSLMSPLFIYQQSSLNKAYFKSILQAVFSQNDPQRKRKKQHIYILWIS